MSLSDSPMDERQDVRESLRLQLTELNNRSRFYSTELWHVPFAYLGFTSIALAQILSEAKAHMYFGYVCLLFGVIGFFVAVHMRRTRGLEQEAVRRLQGVERALGLPEAERAIGSDRPHIYEAGTWLVVATYVLVGGWAICHMA